MTSPLRVTETDETSGPARPQIAIQNPATGETIGHVPNLDPAGVGAIVDAARAAQPAWEALGFKARAALMRDMQAWLLRHRSEVVDAVVSENGKTREDALLAELYYVIDSFGYWAKRAEKILRPRTLRTHSPFLLGRKLMVERRALGVVGVIAPWNYPLTLSVGDAIPALMAGNTVVIKPSEITPLAIGVLVDAAREVGFPEGVLTVANGDGETGAALVDRADFIMFTGSTATGRKVGARCGERLIPCSLELGGKDPMIVLEDADVERAANVAVEWSMRNSGQICLSVERAYVTAPVYDEFVSKVTQKVRALRQGEPREEGSVDVGAITFPPQLDIIERHVDDAVAKGAKVLVGGKRGTGRGQFFEPTVLVDVDPTMACMTEETFGPTLPIMKVADEAEAIRLANDSPYGLGSSVFTKDLERGRRVAQQLVAGSTWVNDAIMSYLGQEAPMGGAKDSGLGARHGEQGITKYTRAHTILVTRFALRHEVTMFPNARPRSKVLDAIVVALFARPGRRKG
ncbi:MAG: succinic semialdehyde dehydrogenase [Solirubrobacteraceae bacterium]|nr:succinic semialdehyde dehydrogenase [Solirubrobacteraceae bacterium]